MLNKISLMAYASGEGGVQSGCASGPFVIQQSLFLRSLIEHGVALDWTIVQNDSFLTLRKEDIIQKMCQQLAEAVSNSIKKKQFFVVLGGDHSSAIGTWSGVYDAIHPSEELGLIWLDAHMDSHTPETTLSGRIHGMPLAALLGYGYPALTSILHDAPKIKPENLCLIGVRSFEQGEEALLKRLNVRIYFIEEVKQRGFKNVLQEALSIVSQNTSRYGLSLDLDVLDPQDVPGVDVKEPDGIAASDLLATIPTLFSDPRLIGLEIAEFNPSQDRKQCTEKLIVDLLKMVVRNKKNDQ